MGAVSLTLLDALTHCALSISSVINSGCVCDHFKNAASATLCAYKASQRSVHSTRIRIAHVSSPMSLSNCKQQCGTHFLPSSCQGVNQSTLVHTATCALSVYESWRSWVVLGVAVICASNCSATMYVHHVALCCEPTTFPWGADVPWVSCRDPRK